MAELIALVWLMAIPSGGLLTIGLIVLATGRTPFNMWGQSWTEREARQLGAVWTAVGATYALWALVGGVALAIERESGGLNPVFGHWWGFIVVMIPGLVLVTGLGIQLAIFDGHRRRVQPVDQAKPQDRGR